MRKVVSHFIKEMNNEPEGYEPKSVRTEFVLAQMEFFGYCYECYGKYFLQDEYLRS